MLLEQFDKNKNAIINPEHFHKQKLENMPKTCVGFFSKSVMDIILKNYDIKLVTDDISNATMSFPIYKINHNGVELAITQLPLGAPACVGNTEELISLGIKNILAVGCCGCLEKEIGEYSIIIPTSAIRDEGTSYHYAEAYDETVLDEKMVKSIEKVFIDHNIHYKKGKTWTTDALFRETKDKTNDRIKRGAIVVDMECSAMNILSEFRSTHFGQFFYAADNLAGEEYDPRSILTQSKSTDTQAKSKIIELALECGNEIDKNF